MLVDAPTCVGPLIWMPVPGDSGVTPHAIVECAACGFWVLVPDGNADDRHADTPVIVSD